MRTLASFVLCSAGLLATASPARAQGQAPRRAIATVGAPVTVKGNRAEGEHILGYMRDRAAAHGVDAPVFRIAAANVQTYEAARGDTPTR